MGSNLLAFFRDSMAGRIVLAALLVLGGAYSARLYYIDAPRMAEKEARQAGAERIEVLADAFDDLVSKRGEALARSLPSPSRWYPAELPCAATIPFGPTDQKLWGDLGVKPDEKTAFQYRFDYEDDAFTIRARRDTDCDGIYAVWVLEGRTDWSSVLGRTTSAQNTKE